MKVKIIFTIFTPLMVTLFLVIFLPTALLIFANPKQQNLYSSYQIKTHGASLQNILYQDQKIVQKLLQNCEDIRNSLVLAYLNQMPYQSVNIALNTTAQTTQNSNVSMYYSMTDPIDSTTYQAYLNIELYVRSFIPNIPSIQDLVWTFQSGIKFWYPSFPNNFSDSYNVFDEFYNRTLENYNLNGSLYTVFVQQSTLQICTPVLNSNDNFLGTVCMHIDGNFLFNSGLVIITKQMYSLVLSTTIIYPQEWPQVVFASNRSGNILFPEQPQSTLIDNNNIRSLWFFNQTYKFYVELTGEYVWYQFPIFLQNYASQTQYVFFLYTNLYIDINQYSIAVSESYLVEVIVIPISLFIFSALVSYFVLNKMINTLVSQIDLLVKKSQSLLDEDLDVKIPEYKQTLEVRKVYDQFDKFSEVVKYSFKYYFDGGNTTDKNVKYYKALKLYTDLKNNIVVGNIYQNLANICNQQNNLTKASEYYKSSLQSIEEVLVAQFSQRTNQNTVKEIYKFLYETKKKIPNQSKHLQTTLIRRYYNYIEVSFRIANKNNFCHDENMRNLLKSIEQFTIILKQRKNDANQIIITIMGAEIYLSKGHLDRAEEKLAVAESLYRQYKNEYDDNNNFGELPPEIVYQYLSLIWGNFSQMENKPLEAFQYYVAAFDGETYEPLVREKLLANLKKLLVMEYLSSSSIRQSVYFQVKTNDPKQYFIVMDFSLSMATKIRVKGSIYTRTQLAVYEALRIFDEHIKPQDRLSFIRFQAGMQQVFNLTEKGKYQRMLRGTIEQMERSELKDGTAIYNTLRTILSNTKTLKKEKIMVFIIDGADNCSNITIKDIQQLAKSLESITILFIYIDMKEDELEELYELRNFCQTCYFVSIYAQDDINRILKGKSYERKYPQSYIL